MEHLVLNHTVPYMTIIPTDLLELMETCPLPPWVWWPHCTSPFNCRSEGPAQVFLLVLTWLVSAFGHLKREDWRKIILSYDNMCHLDNLKVAREPLPLPGDHKYIWQDITKIIDELHIRNHKDSRCRTKYNPEVVKTISKTTNTMSCEQTFAWLSRFKKVICAMPKTHFHFFLHRMIKRRNLYITYCYANNLRPLQPSIKVKI